MLRQRDFHQSYFYWDITHDFYTNLLIAILPHSKTLSTSESLSLPPVLLDLLVNVLLHVLMGKPLHPHLFIPRHFASLNALVSMFLATQAHHRNHHLHAPTYRLY